MSPTRCCRALTIGGLLSIVATPGQAQRFEGTVTITNLSFDRGFLYEHAGGDGDDLRGVLALSMAEILAADAERDVTVMHVKGSKVRSSVDAGMYMILDAETGQTTMVQHGQYYTSFTAEEFEQEMAAMMSMMGAPPGASPTSMRDMMRQAMGGGEPAEPSEPRGLGTRGESGGTTCEWFEANAGDINPGSGAAVMDEAVLMQACVTQDHAYALETYRYLKERMATMPMGDAEPDLEDQVADRLLTRGLPILTKSITKGGGITPSWSFEASTTVVAPGAVANDLLTEHEQWERLPLQQFFMRMMSR